MPQDSIMGPILCNIFLKDFFFFLCNMLIHNFNDDNTLSNFANTVNNLASILESESGCAIYLFWDHGVTVSPNKFQAILFVKINSDLYLNKNITISKENIKVAANIKMLGVHIVSKLNIKTYRHIDIICKSASNQLNVLLRLKRYLGPEEKFVLVKSFLFKF